MTDEQSVICKLLAKALFQKDFEPDGSVSWINVYYECIRQTIPALVVSAIPPEAPFDVRMKWINAAGVHAASNEAVSNGHFALHKLLSAQGIPYVILKGLATAAYYPDPEMRTLGDVDFLIRESDAAACDRLFRENGFRAEENRLPYEWGYQKEQIEFELHLSINGVPEGTAGEITQRYLSGLIETAAPSKAFGQELMLPDTFHHGLVILLHTAKHMVGEGVGFRQICDWAVFVNAMGEAFPAMFAEPLQKIGLWRFALVLSSVCATYIGMPRFSWMEDFEEDFLAEVMEDLLAKGNLRRSADAGVDTILVEKTDKGGVAEGSMAGQLLKNLGQKVKYKWPVMNKAKALIPFGILVMCVQYGCGMLTGKYKKIDPKKLVQDADKKRKLYGRLQLFKGREEP